MKITTNNQYRDLLPRAALPKKVLSDFAYVCSDEPRFVHYRGEWYDALDTQVIEPHKGTVTSPMGWAMHVQPTDPLAKWHAIISDSFFSGVLFRFSYGNRRVKCGTYTS